MHTALPPFLDLDCPPCDNGDISRNHRGVASPYAGEERIGYHFMIGRYGADKSFIFPSILTQHLWALKRFGQ